jgi:hypothetical protein
VTKRIAVGVRVLLTVTAAYLGVSLGAGILLANSALHSNRRAITQRSAFTAILLEEFHAQLEDVSTKAPDGTVLRAWYVRPSNGSASSVILLHGMARQLH